MWCVILSKQFIERNIQEFFSNKIIFDIFAKNLTYVYAELYIWKKKSEVFILNEHMSHV